MVKLIPDRPHGACSLARSCPLHPAQVWPATARAGTTRRRPLSTATTGQPAFSEEPPWLSPGNQIVRNLSKPYLIKLCYASLILGPRNF